MDRRTFLKGAGASLLVAGCSSLKPSVAAKLPILPMTDLVNTLPNSVPLRLAAASHDFGTGTKSPTRGINTNNLGPVLRVKSGQTLPFAVENALSESLALHWHGCTFQATLMAGRIRRSILAEYGQPLPWRHQAGRGATRRPL